LREPAVQEVVARSVPRPDPPSEDNAGKIASSTVNIHRESSPIAVIVQPPAAVSETEVSSVNVIPAEAPAVAPPGSVSLNGAGATFPYPLYAKWFNEFRNVNPDSRIIYQAIGSGGGIRQLLAGTVDFGASDAPMTDQQLSQAHTKILHIPTVLGAVVPIYNVPGVSELRFTPEILAGIFLGKIASWNSPAIVRANPQANLPDQPIIVVHRSDGNGDTFVFTDYLSKVSPEWTSTVGKGTSVKWPIGLGGKGEEGVAGQVRQLQGAIGYVDLIYALLNDVPFGSVRNSSGNFVKASLDSLTEAGASVHEMPADFRVSITNAPGHGAYPISSFSWLLVPQRMRDASRGQVMASFLGWMIDDGEAMTKKMGYAPLPENVASQVRKSLRQLR
jgi:phosphate transport system substrate-binding protein